VMDYGIRLHFTDYGICGVGVSPAVSRCHEVSGDTSPTKIFPNFSTRRPGLCAGCRHFLVTQENLPYWEERIANLEAVKSQQTEAGTWRHARELALSRQIVKNMKEAHDANEATAA
jgi:hypothetical protein